MGSTEDPMDTSLDTPSPSVTTSLNHVDIPLPTRHDSLSPPLTPSLNCADISHCGSSSPLSLQSGDTQLEEREQLERNIHLFMRQSSEINQLGQQILNQMCQLWHHRTSATADCLVEDAADLGVVLLSLANIDQLLFPGKFISSIIEESRERPPLLFILEKIYQLRNKLHFPDQYLSAKLKHLEKYVDELFEAHLKSGRLIPHIYSLPTTEDSFYAILARLKTKRPDIGHINNHGVKRTEFAIILGYCLGGMGFFIPAKYAHNFTMLQIGTAVASGILKNNVRSGKHLKKQ